MPLDRESLKSEMDYYISKDGFGVWNIHNTCVLRRSENFSKYEKILYKNL